MTCIETAEITRIYRGVLIDAQMQVVQNFQKPRKKVIVIAGPTGVGKSELAMALAKLMGGEIVSADSMHVYRGMDIGTAKPTLEDRQQIPHHLIDIREVSEPFNVVDFYHAALRSIQSIHARDRVAIAVGGAGFYVHSLIYGCPSGPPSVPELRSQLEEEAEKRGVEELYRRLQQRDPRYASTITSGDRQKIVRALEIISITGKPVSEITWKEQLKPQNYDYRCWFLSRPKELLYSRIDRRCDEMLKNGFLNEVAGLLEKGIERNNSAAQAIGYRQALKFFATNRSDEEYRQFVASFKSASRSYAKRQCSWFRREPLFRWLDLEMHDKEIALDMIAQNWHSDENRWY